MSLAGVSQEEIVETYTTFFNRSFPLSLALSRETPDADSLSILSIFVVTRSEYGFATSSSLVPPADVKEKLQGASQ